MLSIKTIVIANKEYLERRNYAKILWNRRFPWRSQ